MPLHPSIWSAWVVAGLTVVAAIVHTLITSKKDKEEEEKRNG